MKHVLVVGGSGMLLEALVVLGKQSQHVTHLSRNAAQLHLSFPNTAISKDYHKTSISLQSIEESIEKNGTIEMALLWVHGSGESFKQALLSLLLKQQKDVKVYDVLGSSSLRDLQHTDNSWLHSFPYQYHQIILGKKNDRWLTHQEISEGCMAGIRANKSKYLIGQI